MKPESLVFFDLETTGLAGGTGTYPFLLSFGFIEKCTIKVIQYFLPDFGREVSAFIDLNNYIENRSILVSYNGKSFDYPLLRNRFVLNRIRDPFHSFQHLDLLHFVRRLWKQRLKNCSLVNIEQEIFYFHRWQDIEAAFIPHVYFEFLRDGKTCNMKRVINHNLQDILTLVRLLFHIHFLENHIPETEEIQVLGRFAVENSDLDKLDLIFERMEKINLSPSQDLLVGYSLLLKRMGEWENAIRLWEELLNSGEKTVFACEELAKYYEHRKRDYIQAKNYTERALHYMDMLEEIDRLDEATVTRRSFQYRLERITHKQKSKSE
jgi:tetratricopeptide (TPR) repeat protein